ncbi:MAG: thiamine phosphate synthase [Phycisphaerales bacterium]|nr:thiamine phosphate synthase [Phycisphaerales bacterium]
MVEDAARFVLDAGELAAEAKALRHAITAQVSTLTATGGLNARDVAGDVGTAVDHPGEFTRPNLGSVVEAAGHRAAEALRALEEYAKILDVEAAHALEHLRYRTYDLSAAVTGKVLRAAPATWRVQVLLTESQCRHGWAEVLDACIAGGADSIQVREPTLSKAALLERTRAVIEKARPAGVSVIVNDHADVAVAAGADGVHLGQGDFPVEEARRVIGGGMLLGGSAHDLAEAERNLAAGCDYCGLGRLFSSSTKPDAASASTGILTEVVENWPHWPHLAIGGITMAEIPAIIEAGGRAVAVCGAVCGSDDPAAVVAAMRMALENRVLEEVTEGEPG